MIIFRGQRYKLETKKIAQFYEIYSLKTEFYTFLSFDINPVLRSAPNLYEDWMIGVVLLIFGILAYMRVAYSKRLSRLFNSLVRIQILRQVMREELVFSHRASVLLLINFVLVVSLIVYCALQYFDWHDTNLEGIQLFLAIAGVVSLIYLGKLLLAIFMRWLYKDKGLIREYLFEAFLINKAVGVVFIPIAIGLVFVNTGKLELLFSISGILILLLLAFRVFQGLRMSTSYSVSWVYIILYLCTLEILPFVLLIGVF